MANEQVGFAKEDLKNRLHHATSYGQPLQHIQMDKETESLSVYLAGDVVGLFEGGCQGHTTVFSRSASIKLIVDHPEEEVHRAISESILVFAHLLDACARRARLFPIPHILEEIGRLQLSRQDHIHVFTCEYREEEREITIHTP